MPINLKGFNATYSKPIHCLIILANRLIPSSTLNLHHLLSTSLSANNVASYFTKRCKIRRNSCFTKRCKIRIPHSPTIFLPQTPMCFSSAFLLLCINYTHPYCFCLPEEAVQFQAQLLKCLRPCIYICLMYSKSKKLNKQATAE